MVLGMDSDDILDVIVPRAGFKRGDGFEGI